MTDECSSAPRTISAGSTGDREREGETGGHQILHATRIIDREKQSDKTPPIWVSAEKTDSHIGLNQPVLATQH